jgi:translation initiation factor IF-3
MRNLQRLLEKGNHVKLSVFLRGRELSRPEAGRDLFKRLLEDAKEFAVVAGTVSKDGMSVSLRGKNVSANPKNDKGSRGQPKSDSG